MPKCAAVVLVQTECLLLKLPMKAMPSVSLLWPLVCAPTTPQPRPSNTVPSAATRKLEHKRKYFERPTEGTHYFIRYSSLVDTNFPNKFKITAFSFCALDAKLYSLVSNVIKASLVHMHSLNA